MITTISELKGQNDDFFGVSGDAPTNSGDLIPAIKLANLPSELCGEFGVGKLIYEPYRRHLNKIEIGNTEKSIEIIPITIEFFFQTPYHSTNKAQTFRTVQEAHDAGFIISFEKKSHPEDTPFVDRCAKILALVNMSEFKDNGEIVEPIVDGDKLYGVAYIYANKRNFEIAKTIYGYTQMKEVEPWDLTFKIKSEKITMTTMSGEKPYYVFSISDYYDTVCNTNELLEAFKRDTNVKVQENIGDSAPF